MMRAVDTGQEQDAPPEDNPPSRLVPPVASVRATGFFDEEYVNGRRDTALSPQHAMTETEDEMSDPV